MVRRNLVNFIRIYFLAVAMALVSVGGLSAQTGTSASAKPFDLSALGRLQLTLRESSSCSTNLLVLSDLIKRSGVHELEGHVADLPLAPAPKLYHEQTWSREDIEKALLLRGMTRESIRWQGASECRVQRVPLQEVAQATYLQPDSSQTSSPSEIPLQPKEPLLETKLDKSQFTTPFTTSAIVTQAERVVAVLIENYLQTKTASSGRWIIQPIIPTEHAKILSQRARILGITGGQPPWDGQQQFDMLIKGVQGEQTISLRATIKLPDMVVAVNKPLAKGYVLREEDLVWIPMPRGLSYGSEDCHSEIVSVVGKQLRASLSTQQVIRLNQVGPPMIVHVGDMISIEIVSGAISVATNGRAIEPGGIDDLIQVEIQPQRKRLLARVTGDRTVEVISNGSADGSAINPASNRKLSPRVP